MFNSGFRGILIEICCILGICCFILAIMGFASMKKYLIKRSVISCPMDRGDQRCMSKRSSHRSNLESDHDPCLFATPDLWPGKYNSALGLRQSPINITFCKSLFIPPGMQRVLSFNKQYFTQPRSMTIMNDGYSILLGTCYRNEYPYLSGGPLKHKYRFNLAQFKWGPSNDEGSEHTIDNRRYAMEMQLMHIKGDQVYHSIVDAATEEAAVFLSFLFDVTRQDNPYLAPLIEQLPLVAMPNSTCIVEPFPLCWLFQPFKTKYFHYEGSLTIPPCTEGVEWIIQPEPLSISNRQLDVFRSLRGLAGPITSNSRPVQKLNNRRVQFYM